MGMAAASACKARRRWFRLTPDRCVVLMLALEGFLLLSAWFRWFPFNEHKGWTVLICIASVGVALLLMFLWFLAALLFRLRFQFGILALLLLVIVVAVPCSWLATEMKAARRQREAVAWIEKVGGQVDYDYQFEPPIVGGIPSTKPPAPAWMRDLLGGDLFMDVVQVALTDTLVGDNGFEHLKGLTQLRFLWLGNQVTDAGLEHLKEIPHLGGLYLAGTNVSDAGLEHLEGLTQLGWLDLSDMKVSDAGLQHLRKLTQLQMLWLSGTRVTDVGLDGLKALPQLRVLALGGTKVSDAGLENLKGVNQLETLFLDNTEVTHAGMKKLQQALPKCQIHTLP